METIANVRYATYEDYASSAYERLQEAEEELTGAIEELELKPDSEAGRRLTQIINLISGVLLQLEEVLEYPEDEDDEDE
jgi:hypothetical protein